MVSHKWAWTFMRRVNNVKHEDKHPWLLLHKLSQVALRIISKPPNILLINNFNHETEYKVTHVGSIVFTLMFLLNGENIKTQVRSLPVSYKKICFQVIAW